MGVDEGAENDRIGRLGELEFARLCELAKLSCSKVEPDRTGKDFIVEFAPPALDEWQSFDRRPAPLQFAVQVKTIRSHRRSAAVSLSVAERLARDLRPAIVCVLKIDANDRFVGLHVVHFQDKILGRVLERLRGATGSTRPLHDLTVTFAPNTANRIDYSPSALKDKLATFVPGGMKAYADEKARQIDELGFNEVRILGTLNIQATDVLSLADGFLGLTSLEGATMTMVERRFKIDVPLPMPDGPGKLTITPQPVGKAVVELANAEERVSVEADVYLPPKTIFDGGGKKVVLTWPTGRLALTFEGTYSCQYTENLVWDKPHTVEEWLNGLLVSDIIGSGSATIAVTLPAGEPMMNGEFSMEPMASRAGVIALVRRYLDILAAARAPDIPFDLESLYENRKAVNDTWQFLQGGIDATFDFVWNSTHELDDQDGIYITAAQPGDGRVFGLAVPMTFSFKRDGDEAKGSGKIAPMSAIIELLHEPILESYDHFVERATKLARYELRLVVQLVKNEEEPAENLLPANSLHA